VADSLALIIAFILALTAAFHLGRRMTSLAFRLPPGTVPLTLAGEPFPDFISRYGAAAACLFVEFLMGRADTSETRDAYARAIVRFCAWADHRGHVLEELTPVLVSIYVEQLGLRSPLPTVKLHLAAIQLLFDWFVAAGMVTSNPAQRVPDPELGLRCEDLLEELQSDLDLELRSR